MLFLASTLAIVHSESPNRLTLLGLTSIALMITVRSLVRMSNPLSSLLGVVKPCAGVILALAP